MARDDLYLSHRLVIERALRFTARRHHCSVDEAEDFAAWARLKLLENDYAILAEFQGLAGMATYLAVVVQRLFLDYRIAKWGKWRPSAEAKRLGPLAVRLEMLVVRDGLSLEEAYQILRATDPELQREVVEDLKARLPIRVSRRFEGEEMLDALAAPGAAPEEQVIEKERAAAKRRAGVALMEVLRELDPQDQIILRLRFGEGMQIVDIARTLHLDARALYRRIEVLVAALRRGLAARGITGDDFGWPTSPGGKRQTRGRLDGG